VRNPRPNLQLIDGIDAPTAFEAWSGFVAALAHRLLGADAEVDDVVQDVFLIALDGLGKLRRSEAVRSWLATLTVRTVGRRLRRRKIASFFGIDQLERHEEPSAPSATPEQRQLLRRVYAGLERLPVKERLAWSLHHLEENTLEEVAERCACSLATAKRRIASAQRQLSEELDGLD
jgi:RNA polymerase sigma-70 factor (ECF subfamily)